MFQKPRSQHFYKTKFYTKIFQASLTRTTSILKIIQTSSASRDLDKDQETVLVRFFYLQMLEYNILNFFKARDMLTRLWRLLSFTRSGTSDWLNVQRQQRKMVWTFLWMRTVSLEELNSKLNVFRRNKTTPKADTF